VSGSVRRCALCRCGGRPLADGSVLVGVNRRLAVAASGMLLLCLSAPAQAAPTQAPPATSETCTTPNTVRLDADPERVNVGESVTLTATVTSPCESDRAHSVDISQRPAGVYGDHGDGEPAPQSVTTLMTPPGETATATISIRPERSTDYLYGETDAVHSQSPTITVYATQPDAPAYTCPIVASPTTLQTRPNQPVRVFVANDGEGGPQRPAAALIVRVSPWPYAVIRRTTGTQDAHDFRVPENTRLIVSGDPDLVGHACPRIDVQIQVTPLLTINASRKGPRDYSFTGRVDPGRGQVVTLYRISPAGARVITARARLRADGTFRIDRRFTGSGRFTFRTAVAASNSNLSGTSSNRPTVIY
jgi:hypothetical protein